MGKRPREITINELIETVGKRHPDFTRSTHIGWIERHDLPKAKIKKGKGSTPVEGYYLACFPHIIDYILNARTSRKSLAAAFANFDNLILDALNGIDNNGNFFIYLKFTEEAKRFFRKAHSELDKLDWSPIDNEASKDEINTKKGYDALADEYFNNARFIKESWADLQHNVFMAWMLVPAPLNKIRDFSEFKKFCTSWGTARKNQQILDGIRRWREFFSNIE